MNVSPNSRFLIVSLRYIGDVLLSTPLALSIKTHFPRAKVDYLVFAGTEGVLEKNPFVDRVHTLPVGTYSPAQYLKLFKRYDVALGVNASDRTAIYASAAGRFSISFSYNTPQEWWKRILLSQCRLFPFEKHTVQLMLSQLEPLGIPAIPRVVAHWDDSDLQFARNQLGNNYVLLHPYTRQNYKYWPAQEWAKLAALITEQTNLKPIFTRSKSGHDEAQFQQIKSVSKCPLHSFQQAFSFPQLAAAIRHSSGFIGVDTVVTHMAAAVDAPMLALFGPTLTHNWGPWPNSFDSGNPYERTGRVQQRGNIIVVQHGWPCVPCGLQTCGISRRDKIECLEALPAETIFDEFRRRVLINRQPAQSTVVA